MMMEFFVLGMPQILRTAGANFALFDMEHTDIGFEPVKGQIAGCRGIGLTRLVPVPALQYHFIARCLDVGAMGIMVPMVESAARAREFVAAIRYPSAGRRGAAFTVAHDDYESGSRIEKMAAANERTLVIALVETAAGVEAIDGVDVVWMGPFRLDQFHGSAGPVRQSGLP